jgi:two-component system, cell cycle sensor histidine kinase and response regulator CckA
MLGFAAVGIAHDINNQIHLIVNALSVKDLEGARRAARRCSAMTQNMLSFSRNCSLKPISIDPAEFLFDFVDTLGLPYAVQFRLDLPPDLPLIMADPPSLNRALNNLVDNACDAIDFKGSIRITASPRGISVSDSGPGIPDDVMLRIFEPFFTTKEGMGTGLGLSIVRDLMYQQGGSVSVNSAPGQGACFTLHFRAGELVTEQA